jgi:hypothetical protein
MRQQYRTIATGSIQVHTPSGEVWTLENDWFQSTGETQYYFKSTKGYVSNNYRSPLQAIKEMYRVIRNSEKDNAIEKGYY